MTHFLDELDEFLTRNRWYLYDSRFHHLLKEMRNDGFRERERQRHEYDYRLALSMHTDLNIEWIEISVTDLDDAYRKAELLPDGWEARVYETTEYGKYTTRYVPHLKIRPMEVRETTEAFPTHEKDFYYVGRREPVKRTIPALPNEIEYYEQLYRKTAYDRDGRLRPIIEDWEKLKKAVLKTIQDIKTK